VEKHVLFCSSVNKSKTLVRQSFDCTFSHYSKSSKMFVMPTQNLRNHAAAPRRHSIWFRNQRQSESGKLASFLRPILRRIDATVACARESSAGRFLNPVGIPIINRLLSGSHRRRGKLIFSGHRRINCPVPLEYAGIEIRLFICCRPFVRNAACYR
jgi:hypothetical protein